MRVPLSREQIASVLSMNPSIRFAIIVSKEGIVLDSVGRTGVDSLEPPEETEKLVRRWVLAKGMTSGADNFFGRMKTIIVRREKLVEMFFPLSEQNVIITADPGFPLDEIPRLEILLSKLQAEE